ncbi:MAG TPA: AAA family ATPase [Bacteroidales bacterium]|nr:AAA family ATPase [Bacteroidales bacterium]
MVASGVTELFTKNFPYTPTSDQSTLIEKLSEFIVSEEQNKLFLAKGYAGTGKTTIVSVLVKIIPELKLNTVLLAPTGRAAKVLSSYSGEPAYTIHKGIYRVSEDDSAYFVNLRENKSKNTIFIVDEASMIAGESASPSQLFPASNLLEDLLTFVFSGENCSMIFVGDTAQLPPVGSDISPALNEEYLKSSFHLSTQSFELTEVVRQEEASGILANATHIRKLVYAPEFKNNFFETDGYKDVIRINGSELEDALNTAYSGSGETESIMICRSNKRANLYNNEIRRRLLFREGDINAGDKIMIVKNNYFWISKKSKAGFIANGDIAEVLRIRRIEQFTEEFFFADATIRLIDYPEEKDIEVKLLLNTLTSESPSLSITDFRKLFQAVQENYMHIPEKNKRYRLIYNDPYMNALQIKFAYAMTCHKTQGGQWENVFVEQGYLTDEMVNKEYLRWLYTAVTRSTKKLYLVNFNEQFFR